MKFPRTHVYKDFLIMSVHITFFESGISGGENTHTQTVYRNNSLSIMRVKLYNFYFIQNYMFTAMHIFFIFTRNIRNTFFQIGKMQIISIICIFQCYKKSCVLYPSLISNMYCSHTTVIRIVLQLWAVNCCYFQNYIQ